MKLKTLFFCLCTSYLTACGGGSDSSTPVQVSENHAPIANVADLPTQFILGQLLHFDAGASSDTDDDPLSYQWSIVDKDGNSLLLDSSSIQELTFLPPTASQYQLTLIVNDGNSNSEPYLFTFTVEEAANIIADAGAKQNVKVADIVTLNGVSSESQHGTINQYQWLLLEKPTQSQALINNADAVIATFTADIAGSYIVQLMIVDELNNNDSIQVSIDASVQNQNSAPVAIINADKLNIQVGQQALLDGRASTDADVGDTLTYQWQLTTPSGSQAVLNTTDKIDTMFNADVVGDYTITLISSDQSSSSEPVTQTITASVSNLPPIAVAGPNQIATIGQTVLLNGSASSDPEGDNLSYTWKLFGRPSGSTTLLSNDEQVEASFVVDAAGKYLIALKVFDGQATSILRRSSVVQIDVEDTLKPNAVISSVSTAQVGQSINLDASLSSDPRELNLTYDWQFLVSQGSEQLPSPTSQITQFIPQASGTYIIALTVNNGVQNSSQQTVAIEVTEASP